MLMKNPLTPAGIEPATFRFVAQHLNYCPTMVPASQILIMPIIGGLSLSLAALIGSSLPGADGDDRYVEQWQNRLTGEREIF